MRLVFPALLVTAAVPVIGVGHHGFNVHDDLLAFPQFQVVFPDTYVLEADAQSKLDFASTQASAKPASHTPAVSSHGVSVARPTRGEPENDGDNEDTSELPQSYEYMIVNSTKYLCSVPQIHETAANDTLKTADEAEEAKELEKELERARQRGSQLIRHTDGSCLYYLHGYWSYSFCHNSRVKQFRQLPPGQNGAPNFPPVEDMNVPSFILGQYRGPHSLDARSRSTQQRSTTSHSAGNGRGDGTLQGEQREKATDLVEVESSGNLRYLVQKLDDGTVCDLTNLPRKIVVQYHCAPGPADRIVSVKEVSTCSYRMIVHTPKLCDDVAFQPPQEMPQHQIVCQEIVFNEEEIAKWETRQAAISGADAKVDAQTGHLKDGKNSKPADKADAEDADRKSPKSSRPRGPIIGGIELGGQKVVGKEGRRIEPPPDFLPRLANGNSEEGEVLRSEVIARYDPEKNNRRVWRLSDRELKDRDVGPEDLQEIKSMISEMHKLQPDRRWRIVMEDRERNVRVLMAVFEDTVDLDEAAAAGNEGNKEKVNKVKKGSGKHNTNEQNGGQHAKTQQELVSTDYDDDDGQGDDSYEYGGGGMNGEDGSEEEYYLHEEL